MSSAEENFLPPFGIRGLCATGRRFSVLQISRDQYNSSLQSYPDAVLTWIDEDDGEIITIGSGVEFEECLHDPQPTTAPLITYYNASDAKLRHCKIHLFDINAQSSTSRSVWREHEAYWLKNQIELAAAAATSTSSILDGEPSEATSTSVPSLTTISVDPTSMGNEKQVAGGNSLPDTMIPKDPNPVHALGGQLGTLSGWLENVSSVLQKAAEKSRQTDTSPAEDVLKGMTAILSEVGGFGLEVMGKLNGSSDTNRASSNAQVQTQVADADTPRAGQATSITLTGSPVQPPSGDGDHPDTNFTTTKLVNYERLETELRAAFKKATLSRREHLYWARQRKFQELAIADADLEIEDLNCVPHDDTNGNVTVFDRHMRQLRSDQRRQHLLSTKGAANHLRSRIIQLESQTRSQEVRPNVSEVGEQSKSILDQDAVDADFSARFPPLMSLRRAKSVGSSLISDACTGTFASSILNASTSRPSPRVFDVETKRRKDYAKACFPNQEYTPGLGSLDKPIRLPRPKDSSRITVTQLLTKEEEVNAGSKDELAPRAGQPSCGQSQNLPSSASGHVNTRNGVVSSMHPNQPPSLPGAWPETKTDNTFENTGVTQDPNHESSGDFFNRMVREYPSQTREKGLTRHRSLHDPATQYKRSKTLNRSQTVREGNNLDSRLAQPFEPLFPDTTAEIAAAPSPATTTPKSVGESNGTKSSSVGPSRHVYRSTSERRPRSLYEPYRPSPPAVRPFSPVWEDHLGHTRASDNTNVEAPFQYPPSGNSPAMGRPRHMRSVPNFASSTHPARGLFDPKPLFAPRNVSFSTEEPHVIGDSLGGPDTRAPRLVVTDPALTARASPPTPSSAAALTAAPIVAPVQTSDPFADPDPVEECLLQLKNMGYGLHDMALRARLHVYAAAAQGDVEDAIEMIEEDQEATEATKAGKENLP